MTGMSVIVRTIAHLIIGFIITFGLYIILFGHLTPGGGFAGGMIVALGHMMLMLSSGKAAACAYMPERAASLLDSIGAMGFLCIALLGYTGGFFFLNFLVDQWGKEFELISAGTIPLSNIAIGLKVGASLFLVLIGISAFRRLSDKSPLEELDEE